VIAWCDHPEHARRTRVETATAVIGRCSACEKDVEFECTAASSLDVEHLRWLIDTLPRQSIRGDGNIGRGEASAGRMPASGYVEVVSLAALRAALAVEETP